MKPKLYGLSALRQELRLIDTKLADPVDVYLVGGCAMSYLGLKSATKDADQARRTRLEEIPNSLRVT